jgi:hypothetical protein
VLRGQRISLLILEHLAFKIVRSPFTHHALS